MNIEAEFEKRVTKIFSWFCLPLVVGSSFLLSNITWLIVAPSALEPIQLVKLGAKPKAAQENMSAPLDIQALTSWHLFGVFQASEVVAPEADAPDTKLSLELVGVFAAVDPKKSTAIIQESGREAQLYGVGDQLPGNARLHAVYDDRVVLGRNGRFETLRFPLGEGADQSITMSQLTQGKSTGASSSIKVTPIKRNLNQSVNFTPENLVQKLRSSLQSGGTVALDQFGLESVDSASEKGYRVTSRTPPKLMNMLGLKSGDVLLTVNDTPIGNITKDQSLFNQVVASGQATVTVQSGDRIIRATIPIPKGMMR